MVSYVVCLEIGLAFGQGFGLDFGSDARHHDFYHGEDGGKVVGKPDAGNKVGEQVGGEDEISQGADDDLFVAQRGGRGGEHVEEQERVVYQLASRLEGNRLYFGQKRVGAEVLAISLQSVGGEIVLRHKSRLGFNGSFFGV